MDSPGQNEHYYGDVLFFVILHLLENNFINGNPHYLHA